MKTTQGEILRKVKASPELIEAMMEQLKEMGVERAKGGFRQHGKKIGIQKYSNLERSAAAIVYDRIAAPTHREKLLEAAPNLLEELQHISERIGTVRPNDAFCQALKDIADKAIKKAI